MRSIWRGKAAAWCGVLAVLAWGQAGVAIGEPDPDPCKDALIGLSEADEPSDDCTAHAWPSRCFLMRLDTFLPPPHGAPPAASFSGLPLNIDVLYALGPGSFPPMSRDLARSTFPLVPRQSTAVGPSHTLPERATVNGDTDAVTGRVAFRHTDFALSFGSAEFRHTRTLLSQPVHTSGRDNFSVRSNRREPGYLWDWQGHGWMMGEAPILLIDAHYWGTAFPGPKRCTLVLDAHHSIPFDWSEDQQEYIAPTGHDATLLHDGYLDGNDDWVRPETFTVLLAGGELRYTFHAVYEDTPTLLHSSPHATGWWDPLDPGYGLGVPYIALLERIEDRAGNRAEIEYVPFGTYDCPSDSYLPGCHECCQNCNEKGQIDQIKLYAAGSHEASWTLLYTHRAFYDPALGIRLADEDPVQQGDVHLGRYPSFFSNRLHSIHVYEGDLGPTDVPPNSRNRTLPIELFSAEDPHGVAERGTFDNAFDYQDEMVDPVAFYSLPAAWTHEVVYTHAEARRPLNHNDDEFWPSARFRLGHEAGRGPTLLLRVRVSEREAEGGPGDVTRRYWAYRYRNAYIPSALIADSPTVIQAAFEPRTIARFLEAAPFGDSVSDDARVNQLLLASGNPLGWDTQEVAQYLEDIGPDGAAVDHALMHMADVATIPWGVYLEGLESLDNLQQSSDRAAFAESLAHQAMVDGVVAPFVADAKHRLLFTSDGRPIVSRRGTRGDSTVSRMYRFFVRPEDVSSWLEPGHIGSQYLAYETWGKQSGQIIHDAVYHHPYRLINDAITTLNLDGSAFPATDLSQIRWVFVTDEYETLEDAAGVTFDDGDTGLQGGRLSRRAIFMNAAGMVLRDITWAGDGAGVLAAEGFGEEFLYDEVGRVVEHRTIGWGSPDNQDPENDGLVLLYEYQEPVPDPDPETGERARVSSDVKRRLARLGDSGTNPAVVLEEHVRNAEHPEFPAEVRVYPDATAGWEEGDYGNVGSQHAVRYRHVFGEVDPNVPAGTKPPVRIRTTIGPAAAREPGGTAFVPIEIEYYDETGNRTWRAYGLVQDEEAPGAGGDDELYVDYFRYDHRGRLLFQIVDADPGKEPDHEMVVNPGLDGVEDYKAGLLPQGDSGPLFEPRHPAGAAPLQLLTAYRHAWFGPQRIRHPGGRYEFHAHRPQIKGRVVYTVYKDVVPDGEDWVALSPGSRTLLNAGVVIESQSVAWEELGGGFHGSVHNELDGFIDVGGDVAVVISDIEPSYDDQGRMNGLRVNGVDGGEVEAAVDHNGFGGQIRVREPDGTITRNRYDSLGRRIQTYVGTRDKHPKWRNAEPEHEDDNMLLTEQLFYGLGVRDARQMIARWSLRERSSAQYCATDFEATHEGDLSSFTGFQGGGSGDDESASGMLEVYGHDWRMRPVETRTVALDEAGALPAGRTLAETHTFLDNIDRPRLVASYEGEAPQGAVRPTDLDPTDALPDATAIIAAGGTGLRSLTETIYNDRGQVEEERRYDVTDSGGSWLATRTYYDHRERPLWTSSEGLEIRRTVYDSKGRAVRSSVYAGELEIEQVDESEIERTESTYNNDDLVIATVRWERLDDGSGEIDDPGAVAVRTYAFSWYDTAQRLIATADFGTNRADDVFADGTAPTRPSSPPAVFDEQTGRLIGYTLEHFDESIRGHARVVCYEHDDQGRQSAVLTPITRTNGDPGFRLTRQHHDALGQLIRTVELEYDGTNPGTMVGVLEATAYEYEGGRLTDMAAIFVDNGPYAPSDPGNPGPIGDPIPIGHIFPPLSSMAAGELQRTRLEYGAVIVGPDHDPIGEHGAWVSKVYFPDPATGWDSAEAGLTYTYYADGLLASRTDARGVTLRYAYDARDRLTRVSVDDAAIVGGSWGDLGDTSPLPGMPVDAINKLMFLYGDSGELEHVLAWRRGDPDVIIAHNMFEHDRWGNLLAEHQAYGMLVAQSGHLPVEYEWDVSTLPQGDNRVRLGRMKYPNWLGGNERRVLDYGYGDPGSLDDRLSRVASLTDSTQTSGVGLVASYTYSGRGRHTGTVLGNGIAQTLQTTTGTLGGLDRHGRLRDLHFTDDQEATVHRVKHGYDVAGNRAWSRVTHAALSGPAIDNKRSMLYAHDALGRLAGARMGSLRAGHTALQDGTDAGDDPDPPTPRELAWSLDRLGNRTGDLSAAGQSLIEAYDSDGAPITPVLLETTHDVDLRNRLIDEIRSEDGVPIQGAFDRPFIYDAAGNLVADPEFLYVYDGFNRLVQVYGRGTIDVDPTSSSDDVTGEHDGWLVHFSYDGLGRLIRRQAKWPPSQHTGEHDLRVEHYYYDGARRIQEIFHDPVEAAGPNPQPKPPGWEPSAETRTEREHIHAAYDGAGPDHLHLQVDWFDRQTWMLHDGSGTPLVLTTNTGRVFEQYAWDPYGNLVLRDRYIGINDPYNNVRSRVGHQGLFFDRLDASVVAVQLLPGARGLYQNRNRVYDAQRGRFLQSDPNATGLAVLDAMTRLGGQSRPGGHGAFDLQAHYGDGLSTYAYLGSSPLMRTDPSGLSWDPFDMVDDFIIERAVSAAMFMAEVSTGFNAGLHVAMQVAQLHPGVAAAVAAYRIANGTATGWDALSLLPGGALAKAGAAMAGVRAGARVMPRSGVWDLPRGPRGRQIENAFGGNLPPNFPTIDRWHRGTATSIKSLDLDAATYQSGQRLYSRLSSYIERVGNFKRAERAGLAIKPSDIRRRELLVVVPHRGTPEQWRTFEDARHAAKSLGVKLKVVVH